MPKKEFDHNDMTKVYALGLSQKALSVFNVLYIMRNWLYNTANPSYATLKQRTGIKSDATISAAIKELESNNVMIHKNKWRSNSKKKTSNYYKLIKQT